MTTIGPWREMNMKKILAAALLALGLGVAPHVQAVPSLQFDAAGPYSVTNGGALVVALNVVDLGSEIVAAFDLDVLFDPAVLSLTNVDVNALASMGIDPVLDAGFLYDVVQSAGGLNVAAVSLLLDGDLQAAQGTSVTLFTMTFTGLANAETTLALGPLSVALGKDVKGLNNQPIIPGQAVPEPSTLSLLGLVLIGAAIARQRRRRLA